MSQLGLLVTMIGISNAPEALRPQSFTRSPTHCSSPLCSCLSVSSITAPTPGTCVSWRIPLRDAHCRDGHGSCRRIHGRGPAYRVRVKETMLKAFLDAPGPAWALWVVTAAAAVASIFTFAYPRGWSWEPFGGRAKKAQDSDNVVPEASPAFWVPPSLVRAPGWYWASLPSCWTNRHGGYDDSFRGRGGGKRISRCGTACARAVRLLTVIAIGTMMVLARRRVHRAMEPYDFRSLD